MRTVYLGTSAFAAAVLERLASSEHRPQLVVTRPDRPAGRGRKLTPPPVATAAQQLGIDLYQPESVNTDEAVERVASHSPEALCVCAFGAIVRDPYLSEYEILNVHPSLLPRWRGAAPLERAIMAGDAETGVSIMSLVEELDAGPVCSSQAVPIGPAETYGSLASTLEQIGGEMLVEALNDPRTYGSQDEDGVTYAEKITAVDRTLDAKNSDATKLDRVVRALTPHIGARFELSDSEFLGIRESAVTDLSGPAPGALGVSDGHLMLGCAEGSVLELLVVQPPGGRAMDAAEYLRGHGNSLAD